MRALLQDLILLVLLAAAAPARAETYKWIDEKGVTNYSNHPPANLKKATRLEVVAERISFYTPEPFMKRAIEAGHAPRDRALYGDTDWIARQRQTQAQAMQVAYDECLMQRRVDCYDDGYRTAGYFRYIPLFAIPVHSRHIRPMHAARTSRRSSRSR
jgi:hypothetical protein